MIQVTTGSDKVVAVAHLYYKALSSAAAAAGTEVGTVMAEDRDGPPFNVFHYSLQSGDPLAEKSFSVDPATGAVNVRIPLDRERRPQYRFVVVAYDSKSYVSQSVPASSSATVTVNVLDRNDNDPEFVWPPENATTTSQVSSHAPVGHVITTVTARDADIDENGRVQYSLRPRRPSMDMNNEDVTATRLFRIDPTSGAIVVEGNLLPVSGGTFPLFVVATDGGTPARSSSTAMNICVNKSLPFLTSDIGSSGSMMSSSSYGHNARMTTFNLVVVVAIVCGCSVVVFILIVAIALVRHRDFRRQHARKYNCRMEALRVITSGDTCGIDGRPPEATSTIGITLTSPCSSPAKRISDGSLSTSCNPEV